MSTVFGHTRSVPVQAGERRRATPSTPVETSRPGCWALAVARLGIGFVFLWAFLDKTFGLGYSTPAPGAWLRHGSPTRGFLGGLHAGPLRGVFASWAGAAWADWLFMIGLAAIGVAVMLGVGLRVSAATGSVMLLLMWAAEWPPARFTDTGQPTMSTNPILDYHIVYALVLIVCAAAYAGHTWGLGRAWARLGLVQRHRWLV